MRSDKKHARKSGLQSRSFLDLEERFRKSRRIQEKAIRMIRKEDIVGCYVSMKEEVETYRILQFCLDHDIPLAVPKTTGKTLVFHRIDSLDELKEGTFHVMEPDNDNVVDIEAITIMFVPLTSFDRYGNRTGYGAGYYDSVLSKCRKKIGLAFREQRVDEIISDEWDVKLDEVIYE